MVIHYSRKRDGGNFLSEHFQVWEFQSYDEQLGVLTTDDIYLDDLNIKYLEDIFIAFNCSKIVITSGYRDPEFDVRIGGFAGYHSKGQAVDFMCYDQNGNVIEASHICCHCELMGVLGIGYGGNYTHIDTRDWKSFFNETNGENNISSWFDYFHYDRPINEKQQKLNEIKDVEKQIKDLSIRLEYLTGELESML